MTDKRIDSPLADDDGDAIKRITPERFLSTTTPR